MSRSTSASKPHFGLATEAGLLLLAVGTPLALGGVHRVTQVAVALVACASMVTLWLYRRPTRIDMPWFGLLLAGVTAYTAFQLVPLPLGLLRMIAPASVEVLEVSLAGAGGVPAFHPISLDPSATLWETVKIGSCTLAFIVAHNHLQRRQRRTRLLLALVISGVVMTLLGFIGAVAAPGQQLMLYTPEAGGSGLITTSFVNPNHGAAFLTLCTLLAVGLSVAARDLQQKVLLGLASVLLGSGVFMTLSRGGIVALAVGLGALAVILAVRPSSGGTQRWRAAFVPGAFGLILALSAWLAFDAIVAELATMRPGLDTSLGKLELWPPGLAMVLANPWVGVGRGAFMTAFPRYLDVEFTRTATFSHLENQYLHLPAEWGLIVGGILIIASAVMLVLWLGRARSSPRLAAAAAGLLALAVHNLFDFNLELPGIALAVAVVAGALSRVDRGRSVSGEHQISKEAGGRPRRRSGSSRRLSRRGAMAAWGGVTVLVAVGTGWGLIVAAPSTDEDLRAIGRLMQQGAPDVRVLLRVKAAIRRHPADPWLPLAAGRQLVRSRKPAALAWLNRAMLLYPKNPSIHIETARALRRFGRRGQALVEYRLALESGAPVRGTLKEVLPLTRTVIEVLSALPPRPEVHAAAVAQLAKLKQRALATELVRRARGRWPQSDEVALAEVRLLLAGKEYAPAAQIAKAIAVRSATPEAYHLWALAQSRVRNQNSRNAAIEVIQKAQQLFSGDVSFDFVLASIYLQRHELKQAMQVAEQILALASDTTTLARAHDLLAKIHLADGRPHRARFEQELARKLRSR